MDSKTITKEMLRVFSEYQQANDTLISRWSELIFLTPRWWLGILLSIVPWFIWWKWHNKKYTGDLLRSGFFMMTICLILDSLGVQQGMWIYPYDVFPFIPGYFPWDLTLLPILIMVTIEIKPEMNVFIKAILFAASASFIGEPLAVFAKIYEPIHWKSYYSFPIYILIYFISEKVAKSKLFQSNF